MVSCGQKSKESKKTVSYEQKSNDSKKTVSSSLEGVYKIISEKEEVASNFNINKCNIVVELKKKMTTDELKEIANELKETRVTYDKLWISFFLNGTAKTNGIVWAIANYTPDLNVEIVGSTEREEKELKKNAGNVDGDIIGKFFEEQYTSGTYIVYENNKKIFMKISYKDGSSSVKELETKKIKKGLRLEDKGGNPHGEYFVLNKNGVLDFYSAESMFTSARKID